MDIDRYKDILSTSSDYDLIKVTPILPNPKDVDYSRGYIRRYFIQKVNDTASPIYEIAANKASSYKNGFYYVLTSLDWRISGEVEDVKKSNRESIRIASEDIRRIQLYLPNLLQFHKK
jgi:hypothetical protein